MRTFRSVDLIIPAYNSERTLPACLDAIGRLDTTDLNLQVLVVDNNSTDKTSEIATKRGITVITCSEQGRACARNAGLRESRSPWVAFVDSDVLLRPDWLQKLIPLLNHPAIAAVQGQVIPYTKSGNIVDDFIFEFKKQFTHNTFIDMESLNTHNPILDTAACLYQRDALMKVGGLDEELRFLEDMDLSYRLCAAGYSFRSNFGASAYKISDRNIFSFLNRTRFDAQDMYRYLARHSGPSSLTELIQALTFSTLPKFQWKSPFFELINLANRMMWQLGYIESFLTLKRNIQIQTIKMFPAKLNLLITPEHFEGKSYGLPITRRFYLSDKTLIFYGSNESELLRYQDKGLVDYFRSYLDKTEYSGDKIPHIKRLIQDKVFTLL